MSVGSFSPARFDARRQAAERMDVGPRSRAFGNKRAGHLCRRRRAAWFGQASRLGRWRRLSCDLIRASISQQGGMTMDDTKIEGVGVPVPVSGAVESVSATQQFTRGQS